jgi:hypothetical protein
MNKEKDRSNAIQNYNEATHYSINGNEAFGALPVLENQSLNTKVLHF